MEQLIMYSLEQAMSGQSASFPPADASLQGSWSWAGQEASHKAWAATAHLQQQMASLAAQQHYQQYIDGTLGRRKDEPAPPLSPQQKPMQNLIQAMHAANYSPDLAASLWQPIHGMPGSTQAVAKPVPQLAKLAHPGAASADVGEQGAIAVSKGPSAFHTPAQSDRHLIQAISIKPKAIRAASSHHSGGEESNTSACSSQDNITDSSLSQRLNAPPEQPVSCEDGLLMLLQACDALEKPRRGSTGARFGQSRYSFEGPNIRASYHNGASFRKPSTGIFSASGLHHNRSSSKEAIGGVLKKMTHPGPKSVSKPPRRRGRSELHGPCCHCLVTESPQWRKGPKCKPILCNACGTRFLRTRSLGKSTGKNGSSKRASLSNTTSSSPEELLEASKDLAAASDEPYDDKDEDLDPMGSTEGLQEGPETATDIGKSGKGAAKMENQHDNSDWVPNSAGLSM